MIILKWRKSKYVIRTTSNFLFRSNYEELPEFSSSLNQSTNYDLESNTGNETAISAHENDNNDASSHDKETVPGKKRKRFNVEEFLNKSEQKTKKKKTSRVVDDDDDMSGKVYDNSVSDDKEATPDETNKKKKNRRVVDDDENTNKHVSDDSLPDPKDDLSARKSNKKNRGVVEDDDDNTEHVSRSSLFNDANAVSSIEKPKKKKKITRIVDDDDDRVNANIDDDSSPKDINHSASNKKALRSDDESDTEGEPLKVKKSSMLVDSDDSDAETANKPFKKAGGLDSDSD